MKTATSLAALCSLFLAGVTTAQVAPQEPAGLTAMRTRLNSDLETAKKPIVDRYVIQLETLFRTLTQAKDVNGALAVQQEIELYRPSASTPKLAGTKWACTTGTIIVEFKSGGVVHEVWRGKPSSGNWRLKGNELITKYTEGIDKAWSYTLSDDKKTMTRNDGYIFVLSQDGKP